MSRCASEQARRRSPRPLDADWLVLRDLRTAIASVLGSVARKGGVALDFGCGSKPYEQLFTTAGMRYVGADFGNKAELGIDQMGRLQAADRSSDLVVSFQVLEHVRDLGLYLSEAHRVLRAEGALMLSTHGTWLYHPHPEDHRRWTRGGLIVELSNYGFEVVECIPIVGPLAWTTIIRLTCAKFALDKIPMLGPLLGDLLALLMNLRAMIEDAITPDWVKRENACVYLVLARRKAKGGRR
ncbi:MAG: class I SAM-dependent methyltransferase [Hyphomicrobiaceae bacterium]